MNVDRQSEFFSQKMHENEARSNVLREGSFKKPSHLMPGQQYQVTTTSLSSYRASPRKCKDLHGPARPLVESTASLEDAHQEVMECPLDESFRYAFMEVYHNKSYHVYIL